MDTIKVTEFAKRSGIGINAAYKLAKKPGFPSIRIGKKLLVITDKLPQWFEKEMMKVK